MNIDLRRQVMMATDPKVIYLARNLVCTGSNFFDTGFAPFTEENMNKDFKITIRLSSYTPYGSQSVILGCKYEGTISGQQWPGIYVRQKNNTTFEVGGYNYQNYTISNLLNKNLYIWRKDGKYYSQVDGEAVKTLSVREAVFNQNIVLGAGVQTNGTKFRYSKCTIDYIRVEQLSLQEQVDRLSALYTQSGIVYDINTLDSLKENLSVTAFYTSSTKKLADSDYTLSGELTPGTSTITVTYGEKTTTFTVTVTFKPEIKISDYYKFQRGFTLPRPNGTHETQTTYTKGASALLWDVPIKQGCRFSLPTYDNYKFTFARAASGASYVVADQKADYTFTATNAEEAKSVIVAHINSDYMTDEEIEWIDENAKFYRTQ